MDYKQAFLSQLENSYLGVQIQDAKDLFSQDSLSKEALKKSGFINLLQMKSKYFGHIKNLLEKEKLNHSIYTKLYNFFSSYLNETGTPFFYDTPMHKNIYAKVYTNSKDTSLFYKTQNLYYVKSDTLYHDAEITSQDSKYTFIFDTSHFIPNADNAKNKAIFKFAIEENIRIYVLNDKESLKELPNVFKQNSSDLSDEFIKSLKDKKIQLQEEEIKKILSSYKKQNEIDFFIHKNARAFLQEQFNLWLCNYVLDDITQWRQDKIEELNTLKKVAFSIIDYIADFEDELKAIWCKPKFAKNVHYVFSLDTISNHARDSEQILESIFQDTGFKQQIKEWQELKLIDEHFEIKNINDEQYKFLPLDTKYLSEENYYKLLGAFDNLDEILHGELIKSDNFQALNSLMPKYQDKIDLIYIDPPYNTGGDGFVYTDKFNHSSWLTMMNNRLELAKEFLKNSGSIFISIDDNEQARLKILCDEMFGEENFVANIVWRKRAGGGNDSNHIATEQEYINIYAKNIDYLETYGIGRTDISKYKQDGLGYYLEKPLNDTSLRDSPGLHYDIKLPNGKILKGSEHQWKMSENTFYSRLERSEIIFKNNNKVYYKHYIDITSNLKPSSIWYDFVLNADATNEIKQYFENKIFDTPKPEKLLKRICDIGSSQDSVILDFFAGSGTTIATAHKLGRKWLGVEMGEHFYKVIIPRMKKIIGGFVSGISKEVEFKGGGAFRYYELESYEESLEQCEYVLDKDSLIDYRKSRKLIKGLKKGEKICLDMSKYNKSFDIFTTMSNLLGLKIKSIFLDENGIQSCKFENDDIVNLETIDLIKYPKLRNLIWWEK
ncbi:restriction endonuclease [Helicobacter pullorum]|uniref:site-specific DNA-methyltransferase (adenine-specific) n=1 Tax=Helicobacter pullorum TaxID=35818 RepID=A0AAW3J278_9HELI|nr:site-specific DNA-methyltransferase [Helicobacter pullorum]KPH50187.1 restriction endonuclease [Helicobacter pullorum]